MDSNLGEDTLQLPPQSETFTLAPTNILRLNGDIRSIDQHFAVVIADLKTLNRKNKRSMVNLMLSRGRSPLERAFSCWQKLHKQFKDLIAESRTQAMVTWALLKEFEHVMTTQVVRGSDDLSGLKEEISAFIDAMATQVIRAATLREQLRALIQDIHSTGVDVHEAFRETGRQEANLFQELSQTLRNLDQLKSSFSSVSKEFSAIKRACITCISVVISAAPSGRAHDIPLQYQARTDAAINLYADIIREQEEAARLVQNRNAVHERLQLLENAEQDIERVEKKFGVLPDIWNLIKISMMEVNALLGAVVVSGHRTTFFDAKLNLVKASCQNLSDILHVYASDSQK
ncbi:hypothetical protein ONZ51_g11286 [Trametes cubensis]|uniref:Uncharacterized protein n=1 Tax=Trametes cubensis TaxID=1111947 RepID=A0AAD7THT9_9APHY|nr:hypothetical protein ONZ51_g11286 [Trametes cubensis]